MRKLLSLLLMLLLLSSAAGAENLLITGEGTYGGAPCHLQLLSGSDGFELTLTGGKNRHVQGVRQSDGTLLMGDGGDVALLLAPVSLRTLFAPVMTALDNEPTYEDAVYSSKYVLGQQIHLSAREVSAYLLALLGACPLLDADGAIRAALPEQPSSTEVWATVTRYVADQRQYPNDSLLRLNLFAPVMPAVFAELRTDEFGSSFRFAWAQGRVTDWDETILAIEENSADGGILLKGFTMVDEGLADVNTYLEADLYMGGSHYLIMADLTADAANPSLWTADVEVLDLAAGDQVLVAALEGTVSPQGPAPQVKYTTLVDATDGLTPDERALLGL